MTVLVIDGQGGNLGKQLVQQILLQFPDTDLIAVGTNSIATSNMLKGGAKKAATGENAVVVCAAKADVIVGPLGIVLADALLGEVTQRMAAAVGTSDAVRILIPMSKCDTFVAGVSDTSSAALIDDAMKKLHSVLSAY
ncbi:MAG: DUF3842 family protein [Clostridia bacterium]|nr:DUF3842 family protein [Clostridia bacterium]